MPSFSPSGFVSQPTISNPAQKNQLGLILTLEKEAPPKHLVARIPDFFKMSSEQKIARSVCFHGDLHEWLIKNNFGLRYMHGTSSHPASCARVMTLLFSQPVVCLFRATRRQVRKYFIRRDDVGGKVHRSTNSEQILRAAGIPLDELQVDHIIPR